MTVRAERTILYAAALFLLASCGSPGTPEPPSLELAQPVRDLRAVRKGNEVRLTWTSPSETTDRKIFRHAGATEICRSVGSALINCGTPLATVSASVTSSTPKSASQKANATSYTDQLSTILEMQAPDLNLVYAVSVLNSHGRSAGLSNQVQVPAAPTLPPPSSMAAKLTASGVELTWNPVALPQEIPGLRYAYRVYRHDVETGQDVIAGEVPVGDSNPVLGDTNFQWEKTYEYRVTVVTFAQQANGTVQVEGDDTAPARVVAHDVFPPAVPSGLQAAYSGPGQKPFVDLVWQPDTEPDLAGYNVYRREHNSEPVKKNTELVKTPAFRDLEVLPGHEYSYSVTAMDVRGNESARSTEANENVPQDQ